MNKFGTKEMQPLIDRLRKAARAVPLAAEKPVSCDISEMLSDAADTLEAANGYWAIVEGAMT